MNILKMQGLNAPPPYADSKAKCFRETLAGDHFETAPGPGERANLDPVLPVILGWRPRLFPSDRVDFAKPLRIPRALVVSS
jgi:hypothetical protein